MAKQGTRPGRGGEKRNNVDKQDEEDTGFATGHQEDTRTKRRTQGSPARPEDNTMTGSGLCPVSFFIENPNSKFGE